MTELLEKQTETIVSAGEDDVRLFLREIREFPRLTPEEERDLARRCAEGDEDAIRHMVSSNLRLVVSIAREYAGKIVVYKVDVDKCRQIAQAMGISSIPAILYIPADGSQPVMTVGGRGKDRFKAEIAKYLLK
jgi:hypothetical protein